MRVSRVKLRHSAAAPAFSLAEMMIALVILGFGLLVIGAALPVGLKYTRDTIERGTGEAAAEYALDVLERCIRLRRDLKASATATAPAYYSDLFVPRRDTTVTPERRTFPDHDYEPLIKVRPFVPPTFNLADDPDVDSLPSDLAPSVYRDVEAAVAEWVTRLLPLDAVFLEYDEPEWSSRPWTATLLPSVANVYPPVQAEGTWSAYEFVPAMGGHQETVNPVTELARRRAIQRDITWLAFYRRVSYADGSDPLLYEFIALAIRRPRGVAGGGGQLGFASFNPAGMISPRPGLAAGARGTPLITPTPVPWLGTFTRLPLVPDTAYAGADRVLDPDFLDPPELRFECHKDLFEVLMPGSIFIPAVNCDRPTGLGAAPTAGPRLAGFVPHAPNTLPIYEVTRSADLGGENYEIVVKNNGYYPWVRATGSTADWPVWVIPPAITGWQPDGTPIFDDRSPVLSVARRIVRLAEVP
jgi:hypothetical protein